MVDIVQAWLMPAKDYCERFGSEPVVVDADGWVEIEAVFTDNVKGRRIVAIQMPGGSALALRGYRCGGRKVGIWDAG